MHIPKVVFEPVSLENNIDIVKWAFFQEDGDLDIHTCTLNCFPELNSIDMSLSHDEISNKIEDIVTDNYNKNISIINDYVSKYNKIWSKYNDYYFEVLSKYLNIEFPDSVRIINGFVGIMPVCPRYLDTFDFCISVNTSIDNVMRITSHECCHFLWFVKWEKLYPECPRSHYDNPYIEWKYSEMVVDPILNSDEINEVIGVKEKAYDSFYSIKDKDNKYLMDILKKIYSKSMSIEDKIKEGFEYVCRVLEDYL